VSDSRIKLLFAGFITVLALSLAATIALVGITQGWTTTDVVAVSGPFSAITVAGVTYFLGYSNGATVGRKNGQAGGTP